MINGLDIERFQITMATVENNHTKGKARLRANSPVLNSLKARAKVVVEKI